MRGPIDIGAVRAKHTSFIRRNGLMIDRTLEQAGRFAGDHVKSFSKFKRQSADSLKDATKHKLIRLSSGRKLRISSPKKHALFIEHGTRPHVIRPRRAHMLKFMWRGKLTFARKVNHPGTRPYRFLWHATSAAYRVAGQQLRVGMAKAAAHF
jgi:hypothetical protein